ncbi:porin [Synoicihabitans lomoniglobus]|uniref:Porin n=1 Tax=Synoicihabitans lomoniglobus TaxID=2909285 RepID=A0AAF0CQC8_9BACT|nr:OprO/OprP family phosphate-selective porin [Opitutaceae bacterium LMO-M01]WED66112.1 porin [Opitutaceae bacterium LMO-M01]
MTTNLFRRVVLLGALLSGLATAAMAQDSGALLNVLVRKGILTDQEAEDIRAELTAESHAALMSSISGGKSTHSLAISGRLQVQYAGINTDAAGVDSTNEVFLRRVYFGAKAAVGAGWTANLVYDFAGENFDKAYIEYAGLMGDQAFAVDLGVRKVNFGMEEWTSSGSLDSIERSGTTRYFVEGNNGRRLGAGSYRVGAFFEGNPNARKQKTEGVYYGAAVTNPERSSGPGGASDGSNNSQAYWADIGYSGFFGPESQSSYRVGAAVSLLSDQGGRNPTDGSDLTGFNLYGNLEHGVFKLAGEYLSATVDDGIAAGRDASPWGVWIQPSVMVTDKLELVGRYSFTNSDNRGIKVSDGVRSAPASLTGDNLTELYLGLNYYIVGSDLKLQLGYVHGTAERGDLEESANGVRSQMQINF